MGARLVMPEPDAKMAKAIKTFHMTPHEIAKIFAIFQKLDKVQAGIVPLEDIFAAITMKRNLLTDCLLDLLEIEHDGEINFGEFLLMMSTFCMMEHKEVLHFCFYCFDQDKSGFFSTDDLKALMNAMHDITPPATVSGNVKESWMRLTLPADGQIDFNEFASVSNKFPSLFQPAFRLHQEMQLHWMGEGFWESKVRQLLHSIYLFVLRRF
jgi:Ca2+-binding EF-hand superfamily protein